jgi:hypothetical protein
MTTKTLFGHWQMQFLGGGGQVACKMFLESFWQDLFFTIKDDHKFNHQWQKIDVTNEWKGFLVAIQEGLIIDSLNGNQNPLWLSMIQFLIRECNMFLEKFLTWAIFSNWTWLEIWSPMIWPFFIAVQEDFIVPWWSNYFLSSTI